MWIRLELGLYDPGRMVAMLDSGDSSIGSRGKAHLQGMEDEEFQVASLILILEWWFMMNDNAKKKLCDTPLLKYQNKRWIHTTPLLYLLVWHACCDMFWTE